MNTAKDATKTSPASELSNATSWKSNYLR